MNRRTFVAVGASAAALGAATDAVSQIVNLPAAGKGERVTLSGWVKPAARGPGHYFVLGPHAGVSDPEASEYALWPDELTLVYPEDVAKVRPGRATFEGRFYRGRFKDLGTGHAARAVLTEARQI